MAFNSSRNAVINALLTHNDPSVRWKTLTLALGEDQASRKSKALQREVRSSPRVKALLSCRRADGTIDISSKIDVYAKWQGAHWVLAALADIGYPSDDKTLAPICDQVLDYWLSETYYNEFEAASRAGAYSMKGVPIIRGRYRRCSSQQGNALLSVTRLGLADERAGDLVERLVHWQWPDGGWNCDKNPEADTSSFMETLLPMQGLWAFGQAKRKSKAKQAARRASEVFLCRNLFRRRSGHAVIRSEFTHLHYPLYWHYDVLGGLKAMAELGLIRDERCEEALDLVEQKELPGGGWPAEQRYYKTGKAVAHNTDYVDWGGVSAKTMNPWITVEALYVLRAAGRA